MQGPKYILLQQNKPGICGLLRADRLRRTDSVQPFLSFADAGSACLELRDGYCRLFVSVAEALAAVSNAAFKALCANYCDVHSGFDSFCR